jgi:predicted N-formylglutamate amidohydrolase
MNPATELLSDRDPPPFRAIPGPASDYVITCDHAGRLIPQRLGTLGVSADELETHVAWDIGAAGVAERLGAALGGFVILQTYSRLVIDCNRPLHVESSIATTSEYTTVPGNQGISRAEAELRAQAIFLPYHRRIDLELERQKREGRETVFVAMHSFTPRFKGVDRAWHAGVLYGKDARLGRAVLELLRQEGHLIVGDNEPYAVSELTDYGIVQHAERRGLLCVELEIRQDLIADAAGQASWAERLARVLPEARARARSL